MSPQSVHAFAEKVALITDGASRFGRAIALQLALQGAFVIVGYGSDKDAGAINGLKELGTLADAVKMDAGTFEGAKMLVDAVNVRYGRLDLLVNCARSIPEGSFENTTSDVFGSVMDINAHSAFFVTQLALELMKDRPKGRIINLVSACDTPETEANAAFSMSQAAVIRLTESLAASLPSKYRVNCVAVSERQSGRPTAENALFITDKGVSADDVARVVVYLLSGEAVGLNGQILTVK